MAATPAWLTLPVMLWVALWGMAGQDHVFQGGGWLVWPLAVGLHLLMLRRLDAGRPQAWWPWVHAGGVWLLVVRQAALALPDLVRGPAPVAGLAAVAFVAINTVWLRVAHHWGGVPWDAQALFDSFLVQAGYSILWTLIALVLMVGAHRRGLRAPWMLGAGLLGLTVLKLFVVDLSNRGGSERIVVFIAVGLLMLVVGWFAPLPPSRLQRHPPRDLQGATP
jgi:uncharacterized membrane protein